MKNKLRIVFMGTPDFAVESLKGLVENDFNVVGVVTVADKPAGRGQKILSSPVKKYALEQNIPIMQPDKLKAPEFVEALKKLNADLQVVVAFRMLPEIVWDMPKYGTLNLHGSLLPQYRGAAPINWAIINGEKVSGITTFFIEHNIDTGKIIYREEVPINDNDNAGTLHDKLMFIGADLIVKTVQAITDGEYPQIPQNDCVSEGEELKAAPKIFKNDCRINWNGSVKDTYNFIRGLCPYPAAWTELFSKKQEKQIAIKVFETTAITEAHNEQPGAIATDNKTFFKIAVADGWLSITSLQMAGKKRLAVADFLRGVRLNEYNDSLL